MKTKIILITIFLFTTLHFQSHSQGYHKLINDSLYWDVAVAEMGYICYGYSDWSTPSRSYFNGDSSYINDKVFYHMYGYGFIDLDGELPHCPPFAVDTIPSSIPTAYIREDAINQKVYKYESWNNEERLLFDFSLNQGDTFHSPDIYGDVIIDTVYQFITEDGVSRKMIEFENQYGYMLEGIGGPAGPTSDPFYYFEQGAWLMCVESLNGNNVYGGPCDDFLTGIETPTNAVNEIYVYPNPFNDYIRIEYNQGIHNIRLLSATGIMLKTIDLDTKTTSIETNNLRSGMYFIEIITNNDQIIKRKLLKINSL
jgi:hypothetical protein